MPKLEMYHKSLPYSYALGVFPAMQCLLHKRQSVRRLLLHSQGMGSEGVQKLIAQCERLSIRIETANRVLERISRKENCFAAVVFDKFSGQLTEDSNHIVLHQPSDAGNLGAILRTCLGLRYAQLAIVLPAVDVFDPHTIRASMGAIFSMQVNLYNGFEQYWQAFPNRELYPLMLTGSLPLQQAANQAMKPYTLIFGNEGKGLPESFTDIGQPVHIEQSQQIDSYNLSVAVAITAYQFSMVQATKNSVSSGRRKQKT